METFEVYEEEFLKIRNNLEIKLMSYDAAAATPDENNQIEELIKQSLDLLKEMTLGLDTQTKKLVATKTTDFKDSINSLKVKYDKAKLKTDKDSLMGDRSYDDRQKMTNTQSRYMILINKSLIY